MSFNLGNKLLEIKFVTYLIGKGANGLIYFLSIPIFIKFCGIELYGNYVFIYTAFLMSNSIGTGWISQSVLKFSSKFDQKHSFFKILQYRNKNYKYQCGCSFINFHFSNIFFQAVN